MSRARVGERRVGMRARIQLDLRDSTGWWETGNQRPIVFVYDLTVRNHRGYLRKVFPPPSLAFPRTHETADVSNTERAPRRPPAEVRAVPEVAPAHTQAVLAGPNADAGYQRGPDERPALDGNASEPESDRAARETSPPDGSESETDFDRAPREPQHTNPAPAGTRLLAIAERAWLQEALAAALRQPLWAPPPAEHIHRAIEYCIEQLATAERERDPSRADLEHLARAMMRTWRRLTLL